MAAEPVVAFDSFPDFPLPQLFKAVVLSRIQSLITSIPSRAGPALPPGELRDVGKKKKKSREEKLQHAGEEAGRGEVETHR